jgi:hypothetical protein
MARVYRRRALLLKLESSYGTDPTPTGAANAMLCSELTFGIPHRPLDRALIKPTLGNLGKPVAGRHCTAGFKVELASSGAAGTAPAWGAALRACGWAETVNASASVVYNPISDAAESCTMYWHADGTLHKLTGARGSVAIEITAEEIPYLTFAFVGLYNNPSAAAMPTSDFSGFIAPRAVGKVETPTGSLHSVASIIRSLSIDQNGKTPFRDLIGAAEVSYVDRDIMGQISLGAPAFATKDWHAAARAETLGALSLIHGTTAGRIIELAAPAVQVMDPAYSEQDGLLYLDAALSFTEDSGDDELTITAR